MRKSLSVASLALSTSVVAQLPPGVDKIRSVNLGSWFVVEPYMMQDYWDNDMGARGHCAEWEFVNSAGLDTANAAFRMHWDTMITRDDVHLMRQYGINTVRIPVGFWIVESTKIAGQDFFPEGGMEYLTRGLGWLKDAGIAAIIDLHAVPGASTAGNAFAGQCVDTPGFWQNQNNNFERAADAIRNFTAMAHTDPNWSSVFAIEVLNEPPMTSDQTPGYADYLQQATLAIRNTENQLGVNKQLTLIYMDYNWQYGDNRVNPSDAAAGWGPALYDSHLYYSFGGVIQDNSAAGYLADVCNRGPQKVDSGAEVGNTPLLFGEWWLSEQPGCDDCDLNFYRDFADAQRAAYEKGAGWIFWAWRFRGYDEQRAYKDAVTAGFFPSDASQLSNPDICKPYTNGQWRSSFDPNAHQNPRPGVTEPGVPKVASRVMRPILDRL